MLMMYANALDYFSPSLFTRKTKSKSNKRCVSDTIPETLFYKITVIFEWKSCARGSKLDLRNLTK